MPQSFGDRRQLRASRKQVRTVRMPQECRLVPFGSSNLPNSAETESPDGLRYASFERGELRTYSLPGWRPSAAEPVRGPGSAPNSLGLAQPQVWP